MITETILMRFFYELKEIKIFHAYHVPAVGDEVCFDSKISGATVYKVTDRIFIFEQGHHEIQYELKTIDQ